MYSFLRASRSAAARPERSSVVAPASVTLQVLTPQALTCVGGGLNPQPLPPHVPENF